LLLVPGSFRSHQKKQRPLANRHYMFADFLSLIAGTTMIIAGFMEGKRYGISGLFTGLIVGMVAGVVVFWTTKKALTSLIIRYRLNESALSPTRLVLAWGLVLLLFVCVVLVGILVTRATALLVHH
jgi:dipeptide/tripeptide permease